MLKFLGPKGDRKHKKIGRSYAQFLAQNSKINKKKQGGATLKFLGPKGHQQHKNSPKCVQKRTKIRRIYAQIFDKY